MKRKHKDDTLQKRKRHDHHCMAFGMEFDSVDEAQAYCYFTTCAKNGLLESFEYHPKSYTIFPDVYERVRKEIKLKTKTKIVEKDHLILHSWTYTPDFILYNISDVLKPYFKQSSDGSYVIDIKGMHSAYHDQKSFSMVCKAMYHIKNIFVNKIIVADLCHATFCPDEIRKGVSGKALKKFIGCPTYENFIFNIKEKKK